MNTSTRTLSSGTWPARFISAVSPLRYTRGLWLLASATVMMIGAAACYRMRPLQSAQLNPADLPLRIWVTTPDHTTLLLNAPRIYGDTLGGWVAGAYRETPLSQVIAIRSRERAPTRTAVLVTATSLAMVSTFIYLQGRRDVGNAQVCLNASANMPAPFTPCCIAQDTVPC